MSDYSDFLWEGMINAYGQVATTSISIDQKTVTSEENDHDPIDPPSIGTVYFRDDIHKIAIEYPADWSLTEINSRVGSDGKALRLQKGAWFLVIQYKLLWNKIALRDDLPAGEIVDRGWVTLLDRSIPRKFVVLDGKNKTMFFGDRFEDLEFYIHLDANFSSDTGYYSVDIPDHIIEEAEKIITNIMRTGLPIEPPIPTPTPIPPTPTPIPVPCNAISFQADVTIPDGTIFAPNADFKKTWRLKNIGSCSWTTDYDLVFVEDERMNGNKAIALPEKIRPGEILNISVNLTSPGQAGNHRGYWMLRSGDGEWFGYGKAANKAFWVDIEVVKSRGDYVYDFALNFCAAVWRSEDMRLPCPGFITSEQGYVQLLDTPKLENRNEDELALWVHPNEERYGWLEGIYPAFRVQEDDHFKAWVGCLEGYGKCSLKFYLDYEDEDGKVRRLGDWIEEYDGEVTIIDLDLTDLASKSVRFILGVEAITKNVDEAQGFWFVPVIDRDNK